MSLSRRALFCACLIIVFAILGVWSGPPLTGFWRWPALLLLLSIVLERLRLYKQFDCQRSVERHMALGQVGDYRLAFENLGNGRLFIDCQADYPDSWVAERPLMRWRLEQGERQSRTLTITPVQLGDNALGGLYVRVLGHYGLVWWSRRIDDEIKVKIEPATLAHDMSVLGRSGSGSRRPRFKPGSGFELLALREYRQGDPIRSIDWKATAKRRQPMVRVFDREQRLELVVLVDCGRTSQIHCQLLDRLHHYVNIAARLTEFAAGHDDRVACIAYADRVINIAPLANGIAAVKKTRSLLAQLTASAEEADPLSVALEVRRLLKRRGLVVFLTDIDQIDASAQLIQAVHLLSVKHQVLVASIEDPGINALTVKPVQHWLDPYLNFAALEYRRGRDITRKQLQRRGVSVITAAAEAIDQRVLQHYQYLRDRSEI